MLPAIPQINHLPLTTAEEQLETLTRRKEAIEDDYQRVVALMDPKTTDAANWAEIQAAKVLRGEPIDHSAMSNRDALAAENRVIVAAIAKVQATIDQERRVANKKVLDSLRPALQKHIQSYAKNLATLALTALDEELFFDELGTVVKGVHGKGLEPVRFSFMGSIRDPNSNLAMWFREAAGSGTLTTSDEAIKLLMANERVAANLGRFLVPRKVEGR